MKKIILVILFILLGIILYNIFFVKKVYIIQNQKVINCKNCLIKNEEMAIKIAEPILFDYYGESEIKSERPYTVKLVNNKIWIITGGLNQTILDKIIYGGMPTFGGTFEIKINAKDGAIINMIHDK